MKLIIWKIKFLDWKIIFCTLKLNWCKMLIYFTKSKFMEFWKNSIKEFSLFYQNNQKNRKMMKLDISKKYKTKSSNLELNCKEFQKKKFRDMWICKVLESQIKSSLQIPNLIAFYKIEKLFQGQFLLLNKCLVRKKAEKRPKLMVNCVIKTKRHIKNLMMKDSMKGTGKTLKTLMKKLRNCFLKSI